MADWAEIRRLHKVEKLSKRAIAERLGIHRNTVTRALASDEPPQYRRSKRSSKLDPYQAKIHALLSENPQLSGERIFELIQDEGYPGGISILRDYLRQVRADYKPRDLSLRIRYDPGQN